MSIAGDLIRGHTDAIILARLLRGDSYGYEINKVIATLSNNRFELKEATLYTAFKRLEAWLHRFILGRQRRGRTAALLHHHIRRTGSLPPSAGRMAGNKRNYG